MKAMTETVKRVMDSYCRVLTDELPGQVYGVYLYGSTALGHHNPRRSDIDFFTVLCSLNQHTLPRIQAVHERLLMENDLANKLEGEYSLLSHIPKERRQKWYRYTSMGMFEWEDMDNHITWYQLKHHGMTVWGPDVSALAIEADWKDLRDITRRNLEGYWAKQANRKPETIDPAHVDEAVEFGVLSLCRMYISLETGEMVTKERGGEMMLTRLPDSWHPIVKEALRIREGQEVLSPYTAEERIVLTQSFIRYMSERCSPFLN
ncbi:putative nucleotidyltransferase [Paenibacillus sp. OAS669]|nr:putative nucleotidyltransferase [Paenibacillus sp. OAS669]